MRQGVLKRSMFPVAGIGGHFTPKGSSVKFASPCSIGKCLFSCWQLLISGKRKKDHIGTESDKKCC